MKRFLLASLAFAAVLSFAGVLCAQPRLVEPNRTSRYTVALLTMGPGDHPFLKFGHNALWVHDEQLHRDLVYNYGTFSFSTPNLIPKFLKGRLEYWLSVQELRRTLAVYASENRSVDAQVLALTDDQKLELVRFLEWNARPENKYYRYDYYRDNCSTRLRDLLDHAISGGLRRVASAPAALTWREHTERLSSGDLWVYLGLDVAMGDVIDRRNTVWEEMFLPSVLADTARRATVPRPSGDVPLVATEQRLVTANRMPNPLRPPEWTFRMFLVGAALGAALGSLGAHAARQRSRAHWARWSWAVLVALVTFGSGVLGTLFSLLWAFTDHEVAFHNENIAQFPPWALLGPVFAFGLISRGRLRRRAPSFFASLAAFAAIGLVAKVLPACDQRNWEFIALMVPLWGGVYAGARALGSERDDRQANDETHRPIGVVLDHDRPPVSLDGESAEI